MLRVFIQEPDGADAGASACRTVAPAEIAALVLAGYTVRRDYPLVSDVLGRPEKEDPTD